MIPKKTFDAAIDAGSVEDDSDDALNMSINVIASLDEHTRCITGAIIDTVGPVRFDNRTQSTYHSHNRQVTHPDRVEYSKMPAQKLAEIFTPLLFGAYFQKCKEDPRAVTFVRVCFCLHNWLNACAQSRDSIC